MVTEQDLNLRHFIYQHFVESGLPPEPIAVQQAFGLEQQTVEDIYRRLHDGHFIFLEPGQSQVRIAAPFSAVPTDYQVWINEQLYWANCGWDILGIPAAMKQDAHMEARLPDSNEVIHLAIENGRVRHHGEVVRFPSPVRQWYDDLIDT